MLDSFENRRGIALAFGATVQYCVSVLFGENASVFGTENTKIMKTWPTYVSGKCHTLYLRNEI